MHRHRRRASFGRALANFTESDIPLPKRIAVTGRNIWLRLALRQTCCGHDGEPGC
ncbi:MAG TPA: hypothetical protein VM052_02015 [Candidatus Limnocylindrales bacterium]|nr:hypothetical protein [Candidatus Limnocylindrales bacterium]